MMMMGNLYYRIIRRKKEEEEDDVLLPWRYGVCNHGERNHGGGSVGRANS